MDFKKSNPSVSIYTKANETLAKWDVKEDRVQFNWPLIFIEADSDRNTLEKGLAVILIAAREYYLDKPVR